MADDRGWNPYIPVRERRRKAAREIEKRKKQGHSLSPVILEGRAMVKTFWGKAWCDNLERYSDFANRLPRGRTYLRTGSVIGLQIVPGTIDALVSGSEIYKVTVKVTPVTKARWKSICLDCAGAMDSVVELLQGQFSQGVMERICRRSTGLFPSPKEIEVSCSCPDWAEMCKHVAAVLYGIGVRFDQQPELLFRLHELDEQELIAKMGKALPLAGRKSTASKVLRREDIAGIFGLDMAPDTWGDRGLSGVTGAKPRAAKVPVRKKTTAPGSAKDNPPRSRGSAKNRRKPTG